MGFVNEMNPDETWQTIDHERNILLKRKAMHPEYGYTFELTYKGYIAMFEGFSNMKIHGEPAVGELHRYDMDWQIYRLVIDRNLIGEREAIRGIIREALEVWGWNYRTDKASSVKVTFVHDALGE